MPNAKKTPAKKKNVVVIEIADGAILSIRSNVPLTTVVVDYEVDEESANFKLDGMYSQRMIERATPLPKGVQEAYLGDGEPLDDDDETYECNFCMEVFDSQDELDEHVCSADDEEDEDE